MKLHAPHQLIGPHDSFLGGVRKFFSSDNPGYVMLMNVEAARRYTDSYKSEAFINSFRERCGVVGLHSRS